MPGIPELPAPVCRCYLIVSVFETARPFHIGIFSGYGTSMLLYSQEMQYGPLSSSSAVSPWRENSTVILEPGATATTSSGEKGRGGEGGTLGTSSPFRLRILTSKARFNNRRSRFRTRSEMFANVRQNSSLLPAPWLLLRVNCTPGSVLTGAHPFADSFDSSVGHSPQQHATTTAKQTITAEIMRNRLISTAPAPYAIRAHVLSHGLAVPWRNRPGRVVHDVATSATRRTLGN
jgi:hypothetical protein